MEYAIQLVAPVLLGLFLGVWLDKKFPIAPWGTLGGLILGVLLGIGSLYKRAMLMAEAQKEKQKQQKD